MSMQDALYVINAHFGSTDQEVSIIELGLYDDIATEIDTKNNIKILET